jgi:hypothetical protein
VSCCLLAPAIAARGQDAPGPAQPAPAAGKALEERVAELERAREEAVRERERLERRVEELEREKAAAGEAAAGAEEERLEQRVEELEAAQVAHEDATRSIIAEAMRGIGTKINEFVDFGGVIEVLPSWQEDFGQPQLLGGGSQDDFQSIVLNTAELQFEIQVTDWARSSLVLQYDAAEDVVFTTAEDDQFSVDKINVDTAYVHLGDTERFWPYARIGRQVVPFGISTGDPVADVLSIVDPLTVEVFETRVDALLVGFEFPTPTPTPEVVTPAPPAVRPQVLAPLVGGLARLAGYTPWPAPPPVPAYVVLPPPRPPFALGVYFYDGDTFDKFSREGEWDLRHHMGAFAGYRTKGTCRPLLGGGHPPGELGWWHIFCPWTLDLGVEWIRSVFDSNFLSFDYRSFIAGDPLSGRNPIGFVPGVAASAKTTFGPLSLVAEWNGAIEDADFIDDTLTAFRRRPRAWQVSLGYQFDWNPSVEAIGSQGTYLTLGYTASRDLSGAFRFNPNDQTFFQVGDVPRRRFTAGVGEWVLPNLRLALEYARAWDYSKGHGGTNRVANAVLSMATFEW